MKETDMIDQAHELLRTNRVMSIATLMPDGWPQATMVAYANDGLAIYFVISKESQKFKNLQNDDRVSITLGRDVLHATSIKGLSIAARAQEVEDSAERKNALDLMMQRRPPFKRFDSLGPARAAVMKAEPTLITVIDYSEKFGRSAVLKINPQGGVEDMIERDDDWGFGQDYRPAD